MRAGLALALVAIVAACWLAAGEARFVVELAKAIGSLDVQVGGEAPAP